MSPPRSPAPGAGGRPPPPARRSCRPPWRPPNQYALPVLGRACDAQDLYDNLLGLGLGLAAGLIAAVPARAAVRARRNTRRPAAPHGTPAE
ncbi:hypothetical protein ACFVHB_33710 [Kitasatospora sp. NPDC127111]|uniref:hypothetical protein n=1 Tax=Kitasatospora sp. NPDC127111 TaxID=3345363 RepID=UPI00363618E8